MANDKELIKRIISDPEKNTMNMAANLSLEEKYDMLHHTHNISDIKGVEDAEAFKNYYTKDQIDEALDKKSDTTHDHNPYYAAKDTEHKHINKDVLDSITEERAELWDNKSEFSGKYDDLVGKPTIPTVTNDLTNELKEAYDQAVVDSAANKTAIETLNGTGDGSIHKVVSEEIAKVVGDAPENLDTLRELSDWINSHESDATAMNSAITSNTSEIGALKTEVETLKNKEVALPDDIKAGYDNAADKAHEHDNKNVLDSITAENITNWNEAAAKQESAFDGDYNNLKNKPTIPTVTNDLTNELKEKYDKAVDKMHGHDNKNTLDLITSEKIQNWDAKSEFTGDYNDLINKPTIPTVTNDLTEQLKASYDNAADKAHSHANKAVLDLITTENVTAWNNKSDFSGSYNDLTDKPTITEVTNDLTNELKASYDNAASKAHEHTNKEILEAITAERVAKWDNNNGSGTNDYNDLINKPTIPTVTNDLTDELKASYDQAVVDSTANKTAIETLNGTGAGSVHKVVSDEIAKVVAGADASFDTLKEISDWISGHDDGVAEINSSIADLKEAVKTIPTVTNDLTNELKASYDDAASKSHEHTNAEVINAITAEDVEKWNNGGNSFSGDYNDLINKPTIPTVTNDLTDSLKAGYDNAASKAHEHTNKTVLDAITADHISKWNAKSDFSGDYNDLDNKPTIPTVTNDLTTELKAKYDTAAGKAHEHTNAALLDKLSQSEDGELMYNGVTVQTGEANISKEPNNAIEMKVDGIYSKDFTSDIAAVSERANDIIHAQKTVNEDLDSVHCILADNYTLVTGEYVPFTVKSGNMTVRNGRVVVKSGERVQIDVLLGDTDATYCIKDFTNNINIQEIAPTTHTNGACQFTNNTYDDCEVGVYVSSATITESLDKANVSMSVHEIGRAIVIDPLEYVNAENGIEDTPVGHILLTMSTTVPTHYLLCDGSEYNIEEYLELATYIEQQYGTKNHFGGDGTTTFAVPNFVYTPDPSEEPITNDDTELMQYYIKYEHTYFMVNNIRTLKVGGDIYSNKEIVIGGWINGKPIYRRVTASEYTDSTIELVVHKEVIDGKYVTEYTKTTDAENSFSENMLPGAGNISSSESSTPQYTDEEIQTAVNALYGITE